MATDIRNLKHLGQELRNARKRLGLTQKALATKTGLRQATISDIEKGRHLTGDSLFRIVNVLQLSINLAGIPQTRDVY